MNATLIDRTETSGGGGAEIPRTPHMSGAEDPEHYSDSERRYDELAHDIARANRLISMQPTVFYGGKRTVEALTRSILLPPVGRVALSKAQIDTRFTEIIDGLPWVATS